jgi:hypothetical protein
MKIYRPKTLVSALAFINLHLLKMIEVLRRLSKIINVRSALAEAWIWMLLFSSKVSCSVRVWA